MLMIMILLILMIFLRLIINSLLNHLYYNFINLYNFLSIKFIESKLSSLI
jgi:hypothetical protein